MTRRFPNGETHAGKTGVPFTEYIGDEEQTQGSEPSQYLEEKKAIAIPKVVASEIGTAQTFCTLPAIKSAIRRHAARKKLFLRNAAVSKKSEELTGCGLSAGGVVGPATVELPNQSLVEARWKAGPKSVIVT